MMSLLIAMFTSTFDALRVTTTQRLMHRRAQFCITCEKLFPEWYYNHWRWGSRGCKIGSKLGFNVADAGHLKSTTGSTACRAARHGHALATNQENCPLATKHFQTYGTLEEWSSGGTDEDRWVLWVGGDAEFDEWR